MCHYSSLAMSFSLDNRTKYQCLLISRLGAWEFLCSLQTNAACTADGWTAAFYSARVLSAQTESEELAWSNLTPAQLGCFLLIFGGHWQAQLV